VKPGVLFRSSDEQTTVRVVCEAFDEHVNVIGHEAVRDNCEPQIGRGSQDLREGGINALTRDERTPPPIGAERQEISVRTEIVESLQAFWPVGEHAPEMARGIPAVRLKPDRSG
jgi:hypothetical protein